MKAADAPDPTSPNRVEDHVREPAETRLTRVAEHEWVALRKAFEGFETLGEIGKELACTHFAAIAIPGLDRLDVLPSEFRETGLSERSLAALEAPQELAPRHVWFRF